MALSLSLAWESSLNPKRLFEFRASLGTTRTVYLPIFPDVYNHLNLKADGFELFAVRCFDFLSIYIYIEYICEHTVYIHVCLAGEARVCLNGSLA